MIRRCPQRGFTLVELAIAIFIIALLLGSILVPLATQVEQRQIAETQKSLDEIREALLGFAAANGYLPCPAISATNGLEDRDLVSGLCTGGKRQGFLPWETLGVTRSDAWGRLYRYSVSPLFTPASSFATTSGADITIRTRNAAGALINLTNANLVPVVVLSHGKNGYGATDAQGIAQALPAAWPANNADENSNASATTSFISRTAQASGTSGTGGEFDDLSVWVSRWVLLNRMISAGKLP